MDTAKRFGRPRARAANDDPPPRRTGPAWTEDPRVPLWDALPPIAQEPFEQAIAAYECFSRGATPQPDDTRHIAFRADGLTFKDLKFPFDVVLASRRLDFSLHFCNCDFVQGFDARWAHLDSLSIKDSRLQREFKANAIEVGGNIDLSRTLSLVQLDLAVARIQGDLVLVNSRLYYDPRGRTRDQVPDVRYGTALFCGGLHVHSILMDGVHSAGRIFLDAAKLTGILKASDAELRRYGSDEGLGRERVEHIVLSATDTDIEGAVILGDEGLVEGTKPRTFLACGQISIANSRIGGDFICTNGKFHSAFYKCGDALFEAFVKPHPPYARIVLSSIDASRTKIEGGVWLDRKFEAFGAVIFDSVEVKGAFMASDAEISIALPNCEAYATAGSQRHWLSIALSLDRAQIGNALKLHRGFRTFGSVNARNAMISGDVECDGGHFQGAWQTNPEPLEWQPEALVLSGATVGGSVFLTGNEKDGQPDEKWTFRAKGQVRLRGTRIERNLHLGGGYFERLPKPVEQRASGPPPAHQPDDEQEVVAWFHSARVMGTTFFIEPDRPPVHFLGSASFAGMQTDVWQDRMDCWAHGGKIDVKHRATFELNGLVYKRLQGPMLGPERVVWLLHQPMKDLSAPPRRGAASSNGAADLEKGFKTQPWEQCAHVLYELGYRREARFLFRMEQRFVRLKGNPRWPERLFGFILGTFVGHGYNVFYTVLWAAWLFILGAIVADIGYRDGYIVHVPMGSNASIAAPVTAAGPPGKCLDVLAAAAPPAETEAAPMQSEYPAFHPLFYAIDLALPTGDLRQMKFWIAVDRRSHTHPPPNRLVVRSNRIAGRLIGTKADFIYDAADAVLQPGLRLVSSAWQFVFPSAATPAGARAAASDRPDSCVDSKAFPELKRFTAGKAVSERSAIAIAFMVGFLVTLFVGLRWLRPAATFRFPRTKYLASRPALRLYHRVLDRDRNFFLRVIPPAFVVLFIFGFFVVTTLYLLNAYYVAEAIHVLDGFFLYRFGLSFVHFWSSGETLMGLLLITAVAIGLGSAVFRGRD